MEAGLAALILLSGLAVLLAAGLEIAVSIGIVASAGLLFFVPGNPIDQFAFKAFGSMNSFTLTAVPLFVFMGVVFHSSGVIRILFNAAGKLISGVPGGLVCSVILGNGIFGAMSGSSLAATATFGKIFYPNMERLGYSSRLTLGSIAVGGTLSVLIPPSVVLIVYGGWQNVSVARLFAAGLIPGILLCLALMGTVIVLVKLNPGLAPKMQHVDIKEKLAAAGQVLPFLLVIIIILGMIFMGIMTPTESGAIGAFLSVVFACAYRKMSLSVIKESTWSAVKITSMLAFLMFTAKVLGQVFQYLGLTEMFSVFMVNLPLGKYGILIIIYVMYIILGMFFEGISMLVLTFPLVTPIIENLGFDAIWFGVVYVVLAEISLVTPPFGLNLFVLNSVVPDQDIMKIALGVVPFIIPLFFMIALLTVFPELALWLPGILY